MAPSVSWFPDGWRIAIGGLGRVELVTLTFAGSEVSRIPFPDGYGFPVVNGDWLAYKTNDATGSRAQLIRLSTGETHTFDPAAGNFPIALNDTWCAWQTPANYTINRVTLANPSDPAVIIGNGAPDGLAWIDRAGMAVLIKDVRFFVPGLLNPQLAGTVWVGEQPDLAAQWPLGMALALDGIAKRKWLLGGQECNTPRIACSPDGQSFAIVTWGREGVRCQLLSLAEIQALPGPPAVPAIVWPEPRSPKQTSGEIADLLTFVLGDPATWPRKGGYEGTGHPAHQYGPTADNAFFYVLFDAPEAYGAMAFDAEWIFLLEDAQGSGDPPRPYSFSDARWWPRRMQIGYAHRFESGDHEMVWRERGTCQVVKRQHVARKMWVEGRYDPYWWGHDLGDSETLVLVYDPSGQPGLSPVDGAARGVELNYYARGAGLVRWEYHRSDLVYASGTPTFTDATRVARSDFYLFGARALAPLLTNCVPYRAPVPRPPEVPIVPFPKSFDDWRINEYPQVLAARRRFLNDPTWQAPEGWEAHQTGQRYGFQAVTDQTKNPVTLTPLSLEAMIAHEDPGSQEPP